jgi:hypothetical protein
MPPPPQQPAQDASFELAAKKGWCRGEETRVDACLLATAAAATSGGGGGGAPTSSPSPSPSPSSQDFCMRELLALQKCLRARTLAERAIRGDNMGRS